MSNICENCYQPPTCENRRQCDLYGYGDDTPVLQFFKSSQGLPESEACYGVNLNGALIGYVCQVWDSFKRGNGCDIPSTDVKRWRFKSKDAKAWDGYYHTSRKAAVDALSAVHQGEGEE